MTQRTLEELHAVEREAELWIKQSITEHLARYHAVGCEITVNHDEYIISRPANFAELSPEQQWAIDKALGQLDSPHVQPLEVRTEARSGALHVRTSVRRVPTPDALPPARFVHDCARCVRFASNSVGDWYTCLNPVIIGRSLLCRTSNEPGDYISMPLDAVAPGFLAAALIAGLRLTDDEAREIAGTLLRLRAFDSPAQFQALLGYLDQTSDGLDVENLASIDKLISRAVQERP